MLMVTSHILKSMDFTKTQTPRYLENETLFFLQIKKFINYTSMPKNSFLCGGNRPLTKIWLNKNDANDIGGTFYWIV